jgi:hypothetical protein
MRILGWDDKEQKEVEEEMLENENKQKMFIKFSSAMKSKQE